MHKDSSKILIGLTAVVLLVGFIAMISSSATSKIGSNEPHIHTDECEHSHEEGHVHTDECEHGNEEGHIHTDECQH